MKYTCICLAAGSGSRLNLGYNKVLHVLKNGMSILENALINFIKDDDCIKIVLVHNEEIKLNVDDSKIVFVKGADKRMFSVYNGLQEVKTDYVMIHDGARPFLKFEHLEKLKKELEKSDAVVLGVKAKDSIKEIDENGFIVKSLDRENILLAQTPQCFKTKLIKKAFESNVCDVTDDASLIEAIGFKVKFVEGDHSNIKITFKEDLEINLI